MKIAFISLFVIGWSLNGISQITDTVYVGTASYYHTRFDGRKTANGEKFSNDSLTAAHPFLAFGTVVRIINLNNNKEVVVRINDRLPKKSKRMIDLSQKAAREIGMLQKGLQQVELIILPFNLGSEKSTGENDLETE